jgi:DNA invertase Pin-like site-specific DNA recombinase
MSIAVGYARVSTQEQDLALQLDALQAAGCARIYTEKASGAQRDRPQLQAALDYMRADDTLVVWKLAAYSSAAQSRGTDCRSRLLCAGGSGRL